MKRNIHIYTGPTLVDIVSGWFAPNVWVDAISTGTYGINIQTTLTESQVLDLIREHSPMGGWKPNDIRFLKPVGEGD